MITASAPIAENVLSFLKCAFCCPIIEAYGQTESCGASFSTKIFDNKAGHVGGPALGIEYKLKEIEEMGYTRSSFPYPAGEVCLRGPSVFLGYFRNKALTDQVKDEDGWLHTGDVGQMVEGNALQIIDRIKNIFKLSQGEYIVSEKLERVYEQSPYVNQIFIYGDSFKNHIVAIIYPDYDRLKRDAGLNTFHSAEELSIHPEIFKLVQKSMEALAVENHFNSLERVRNNFKLVIQEFEVGRVLTPTLKLRR